MTAPAAQPSPFDPAYAGQDGVQAPAHHPGWQPAVPACRLCGAQPAAAVAVRAHQGLLLMMRFHKIDGPFCRSCGTAVVRELTTKTLWQGWWSPFSLVFFSPFTLVWNLLASRKLAALPAPGPPALGAARVQEGKPVHRRPMAYVAIVPLIWAVWFITGMITHA
ncbi:hypothetical protein OG413_43810 [Streptomyces sp. NBC_01433]|uniref:hypothetical protein n=1 Tax=Streptomyces sp. NBC_01433 TaxID=2903864 RepID=UPI0022515AFA|nr:hypothetical protein [Streptomyces sp. NBC_01433]MCX4682111.1 hypothetical protein [Streptomyces sp. NBC_01433]